MILSRLFILISVAFITAALSVPVDATHGGGLTLEGWWLAAFGMALLPQALRKEWGGEATLLATVFLLASAGWLSITEPLWLNEFTIRPHNFKNWSHKLALALIAAQSILVARGMLTHTALRKTLLKVALRPRTLLVVLVLLVTCGPHFTLLYPHWDENNFRIFFLVQMAAALFMSVMAVGNLALLYRALPGGFGERMAEATAARVSLPWNESTGRWDGRLGAMLGLLAFAISALVAWVVFDRLPHIPDGLAYLFQARTIADGAFAMPALPSPDSFPIYLIDHRDGLSFSITNPGWPMVLAIGDCIGLAWLVNPILAGLTLFVSHKWIARVTTIGWANLICILMATSPWYLYLGASHMTHLATMFFFVAGNLAATMARDSHRSDRAFLSGLCFGMVLLIRPLDGLLLGGMAGLFLLISALKAGRSKLVLPVAFSIGAIIVSSVLLVFNHSLTGDALSTPTNTYIAQRWPDSTNRLGFGPEVGNPPGGWGKLDPIPGHGWRDVLLNSNQNLANLNVELFGWTTGSLFLLACFLLFVRKLEKLDRIALASIVLLFFGYNLYWFSGGPDFGPRYWFSMLVPVLWLSGRGLFSLFETLKSQGAAAVGRVSAIFGVLLICGLGLFGSWRATSRYHDYRGFHSDYREMLEAGEFGNAVVFIDTPLNRGDTDFGSAFLLNDFSFAADKPVFVRDLGMPANAVVMAAFPGKPAVFVDGRVKTGSRARIRLR